VSTYLELAARNTGFGEGAFELLPLSSLHEVTRFVPSVFEFSACTLLYCLIPNCAVRWRDGALGAVIATLAVEVLKVGFTIYIGEFSSYRTIYGALATIPIFLLWMYITWVAVLLGAVVAAAMPNWRIDERAAELPQGGVRLGLSLALIAALARLQRRGGVVATPQLARELGVATTVIDEHLKPLEEAGFVAHTQEGCWVLSWSPHSATLHDLYEALSLPLAGHWTGRSAAPWQRQVAGAMERIVAAETAAMQVRIAELLPDFVDPPAPEPRRRPAAAAETLPSE
jgi:membrane protein